MQKLFKILYSRLSQKHIVFIAFLNFQNLKFWKLLYFGVFFKFPKLKILETSIFFFLFFQKLKKIIISLIYKGIIVIFSVSLPMVYIYMLCKIFDPTTWRTSRTTNTRRWRSTPKVWVTQNFIKKLNDRKEVTGTQEGNTLF